MGSVQWAVWNDAEHSDGKERALLEEIDLGTSFRDTTETSSGVDEKKANPPLLSRSPCQNTETAPPPAP